MNKTSQLILDRINFLRNVTGMHNISQEIDFGSGVIRIVAIEDCPISRRHATTTEDLVITIQLSNDKYDRA